MAASVDPLVEDKVDGKVFHGRVKKFLHRLGGAVNFVDEEHIPFTQVSENPDQIPPFFKGRARRHGQGSAHFIGDDMGQGGLAQARRSMEKNVFQGFGPQLSRFDGDLQGFHHLGLPHVFMQPLGTQGQNVRIAVIGLDGTIDDGRVI